jgi:hypothetical protein
MICEAEADRTGVNMDRVAATTQLIEKLDAGLLTLRRSPALLALSPYGTS